MKIVKMVTPLERQNWDPTGKVTAKVRALMAGTVTKPGSPNPLISISSEEMLERYASMMSKLKWRKHSQHYLTYNQEMYAKYAPQGGSVPGGDILQVLDEYYHPPRFSAAPEPLVRARDYLLQELRECMQRYGVPQIQPERGVDGTYAAIPSGSRKGTFYAETQGMTPWRHVYPEVAGTRIMRNSLRAIFMSATPNVRYIEAELTAVRNWLKLYLPHYFGAWLNPWKVTYPSITASLDKGFTSIETDYIGMDKRFTWHLVEELILPIYELLLPEGHYWHFAQAIEESFTSPLFLGDVIWTGEHSLFSGQGPTNDFETLYTIILQLAALQRFTVRPRAYHLALGDDSALLTKLTVEQADSTMRYMIDLSAEVGMLIHSTEKSRIARGDVRFCRRCHGVNDSRISGVIPGYYPSVLVLNNIVQPEKLQENVKTQVAADLCRMDNLQYNKEFTPFIQLVRRFYVADLTCPADVLPSDWWSKLYGEVWNPQSSPTYRFYTNQEH